MLVQPVLRGRAVDQRRIRGDDRFHDADVVVGRVDLAGVFVAHQLELGLVHQPLQGVRLADEDQHVVGAQLGVRRRFVDAVARAHQREHLDLAFRQLLDLADGLADERRAFGNRDLGGVAFEVEGLVHGGRALAVGRQQPPAEGEEDHAADGEAGPDRREVEHRERRAEQFLAHARDDDVGRRADQRDDAAEQRRERHRHQQTARPRCCSCARAGTPPASASRARRCSSRRRTAAPPSPPAPPPARSVASDTAQSAAAASPRCRSAAPPR